MQDELTLRSTNISKVETQISLPQRRRMNGHRGGIFWFTGLSGAGKTTLSIALENYLFHQGYQVIALDGDSLRHGLSADLGFSAADRTENIRRVGEVAALFAQSGMVVITAFISPYRADRDRIRKRYPDLFQEIYLSATLSDCERRDPKGLYSKARAGEILNFTGISAPYEIPANSDLILDTGRERVEQSLATLIEYVTKHTTIDPVHLEIHRVLVLECLNRAESEND